ncbi:hypothetical protein BS78_07G099800 [Paspalum vaginatum]|nr:hypothetical protein BS78_07G099800 [Paspalum vaginatum]
MAMVHTSSQSVVCCKMSFGNVFARSSYPSTKEVLCVLIEQWLELLV